MRAIHSCHWLKFVIVCLSGINRESSAGVNTQIKFPENSPGGATLILSIFGPIEKMEVYAHRFGPEYSWAETTSSSGADCEVLSGRVLVPSAAVRRYNSRWSDQTARGPGERALRILRFRRPARMPMLPAMVLRQE
jgi:hypothetical protein